MINSSGVVEDQRTYDPFGRVAQLQGSMASDFQFGSYYFHARSGLLLTRARAYSANLGRFINRDPIGVEGGHNLYSYVGGNPIQFLDASGLEQLSPPITGTSPNLDSAIQSAQVAAQRASNDTGVEYSGVIYASPSAAVMWAVIEKGTANNVNMSDLTDEALNAGNTPIIVFHTHGTEVPNDTLPDVPSIEDLSNQTQGNSLAAVFAPNGNVFIINPATAQAWLIDSNGNWNPYAGPFSSGENGGIPVDTCGNPWQTSPNNPANQPPSDPGKIDVWEF
jgi:RHS repeat-associated protein